MIVFVNLGKGPVSWVGKLKPVAGVGNAVSQLTESGSAVRVCQIWGFHGSDYEECHLLGYKNPVRTSQETHYVSTTESSQLMLCKIWGFHDNDYEEWRLLGCYAVWLVLRTEVSEELSASFIRVTRIGELGTTLAVTNDQHTLQRHTKWERKLVWNSELRMQRGMGVLTRAKRRNIPEDAILHSHRRENLKSYIALTGWTL
jgi:hypothetical protein